MLTNAVPGDPVVVRLGVIDEATTVHASGTATATVRAPNELGDAVGTVQVGVVDLPFTVTIHATAAPIETTITTALPAPTTPPPVTGLDDTATLVGLDAALGVLATARQPSLHHSTPLRAENDAQSDSNELDRTILDEERPPRVGFARRRSVAMSKARLEPCSAQGPSGPSSL